MNDFECDFSSFQTSRSGANIGSRPYSLITQNNGHYNYGIAFTGIQLPAGSNLLPVKATTDPNQETNEIVDNCDTRPKPITLRVSLQVLNPAGVAYGLYRFSSFDDAAALDYSKAVQLNPSTPNPMDSIASDSLAIYRAVRVA